MKTQAGRMFTEDMIAPCGLDCSLCKHAQDKENPCHGCTGPDEFKPTYCFEVCGIIPCAKRRENGYRFCNECYDYPCDDVIEKEIRYATEYPLIESPFKNLRLIHEIGIEDFLEQEREEWTCKKCGSPVCVHNGICSGCGTNYRIKI